MSSRTLLAALAAVLAALAVALPASARTETRVPILPPISIGIGTGIAGSPACQILVRQIQLALLLRSTLMANLLSNAFLYSGCGGAAI
jgi:hypothetical protein